MYSRRPELLSPLRKAWLCSSECRGLFGIKQSVKERKGRGRRRETGGVGKEWGHRRPLGLPPLARPRPRPTAPFSLGVFPAGPWGLKAWGMGSDGGAGGGALGSAFCSEGSLLAAPDGATFSCSSPPPSCLISEASVSSRSQTRRV